MSKLTDMTGQIHGGLQIIEKCAPPPDSKRRGAHWLCRCLLCKKLLRRRGTDLRKGKPPESCGCRRKPMTTLAAGVDLGGIVIVDKVEGSGVKNPKWNCRCKACGETRPWWASTLRLSPNRKDCGCGREKARSKPGPARWYEPGRCPTVATCGPCQREGRADCRFTSEQLAWFRGYAA